MALSEVKLRNDDRYPAAPDGVDAGAATDGYVWTYDAASGGWIAAPAAAGVTDHGELSGLSDDDHPNYLNAARGDARYAALAHSHPKLDRLPDAETSQRVAYVSPTGIDSGSGSSSAPWKTIQYAVNQSRAFMQPANSTSGYKIIAAAGVYEESITIPPNEFSAMNALGQGGVWITSASGVALDVVIRNTAGAGGILAYGSCTLDLITVENDNQAISPRGSLAVTVFVKDCTLRRYSTTDGGYATIDGQLANIISRNNSTTTGRRFQYGLSARFGSPISKVGSQPTGTVANEIASGGGVIR